MNDLYFACRSCKTYIDAGYRWAYWTLEHPGVVRRGEPVQIAELLNASEYWAGRTDSERLEQILIDVRNFLTQHGTHDLVFDEEESFRPIEETGGFLDWREVGAEGSSDLSPQDFAELGLKDWDDVVAHVSKLKNKPWWWNDSEFHFQKLARGKFESLIQSESARRPIALLLKCE